MKDARTPSSTPSVPKVRARAQPHPRRAAVPASCGRLSGRAALAAARLRRPDVEDQHVGADEEHDQALDQVREVARETGSISLDCRPWFVPKSSAPKRSALRPTPTAVLRPSSATAMPRKPTAETGMSETPKR